MKIRNRWIGCTGFLIAIAVGSLAIAQNNSVPQSLRGSASVAGPAEKQVSLRLEGIWAGVGYLDEEKLAERLKGMPEGKDRDELIHKAATFLSIVLAIEFRADGKLESELEVVDADGKTMAEPSIGTWRLLEKKENRMLVELKETLADKTERVTKRLIQFYEDGEHVGILFEVDPLLAEFNPLVVCERIPPEAIARQEAETTDNGASRIR